MPLPTPLDSSLSCERAPLALHSPLSGRSSFGKSGSSSEEEYDLGEDLEHAVAKKATRSRRPSWWRKGRTMSTAGQRIDAAGDSPGLLTNLYRADVRAKRRRNWFNYFVFGGISGCAILTCLLTINLILGVLTIFWAGDIDHILREWGKPGTGTEGLAWYPTDFTRDINPIPCHSHNDYWRRVPLFSALRVGCTGVEADVWLFDGDLYVGHNTASLTRNRTFQSLYVNPLVQLLENQNRETDFYNGTSHGVFDTDPGKSLILLIDVKTAGAETWPWVLAQLEPLRERGWLTHVINDTVISRPVTVVGTGNTPFDVLTANTTYRDAFFDAPLKQMWEPRATFSQKKHWGGLNNRTPRESFVRDRGLAEDPAETDINITSTLPATNVHTVGQGLSGVTAETEFNSTNSYYASVSFNEAVGTLWSGRLSRRQIGIIRGQVRGAHRRGLKVRYWDLPSWPLGLRNHIWDFLVKEGVDMLNVDDLRAASRQVW